MKVFMGKHNKLGKQNTTTQNMTKYVVKLKCAEGALKL